MSIFLWMVCLTVSVCVIIISAAVGEPSGYLAMSGLVSLAFALIAIRENGALRASGASRSAIGASTARYMGLVWMWGALALLVTYYFILTPWREWWQFFIAFAMVGSLCMVFAAVLSRDAEAKREDETMLRLGRYLTIGQLVGTLIAVVGLNLDPDKNFVNTNREDWAANNVFLFGSLALAAISFHALWSDKGAVAKNTGNG